MQKCRNLIRKNRAKVQGGGNKVKGYKERRCRSVKIKVSFESAVSSQNMHMRISHHHRSRLIPDPRSVSETLERWLGRVAGLHGQGGGRLGAVDEDGLADSGNLDAECLEDRDGGVRQSEGQVVQDGIVGKDLANEGSDDLGRVERRSRGVVGDELRGLVRWLPLAGGSSVKCGDDVSASKAGLVGGVDHNRATKEGEVLREESKVVIGVPEGRNFAGAGAVELAMLAAKVAFLAVLGEGGVTDEGL